MNITTAKAKRAPRRVTKDEPASLPMWLTIVAQAAEARAEQLQEASK